MADGELENGSGSRLSSDSVETRERAVVDLFLRVRWNKRLRLERKVSLSEEGMSCDVARRV